jgi:hypothetical protein
MTTAALVVSSMNRAMAYPCRGERSRVLRIKASSVPWSSAFVVFMSFRA